MPTNKKAPPSPLKSKMQKIGDELKSKGAFRSESEIEAWEKEKAACTGNQMIKEDTDQAKGAIGKHPLPHEQLLFSFMPTTMTRTSPFFPMSRKDMKSRPIESGLTWETAWGRITITGERLSIYDESVLLSLLVLVKKHKSEAIATTQYELCKIGNVNPATNTYNTIWGAIKRLAGTRIDIEIREGKGSQAKLVQEMTGSIISWAGRDHKTGKLRVVLNPYFLQMYGDGFLTNLDLKFRANLKGDTAKALYRFYQGQQPLYSKGRYEIQLLKLCVAINLNTENVEIKRLREQIRKGLRELRKQGYLERWRLNKQDYVIVWRGDRKRVKQLPTT
jgi:hypothetical protein